MKSIHPLPLPDVPGAPEKQDSLPATSAAEERRLVRLLGRGSAGSPALDPLSEEEIVQVLRLSAKLILQPARSSRDLAADLGLRREELIRLYRVIREVQQIQDALTFESPFRRRVSFLRRELMQGNLTTLKSMLNGEVCLPNHVEFHPALLCNLRCRACPNCQPGSNGEWHFVGYPQLGQPLDASRLRMIQEMFIELGVESFSFGGGGEPSLSELTVDGIAHLREESEGAEISLYTNGIFPDLWAEREHEMLVGSLNKIRFSIDAANAQEWSQYKGREPELFETLWKNIQDVVEAKKRTGSETRIGASCLISNFTSNVEAFLLRARDTGLDFCDIKEIETCYGEKSDYKAVTATRKSFAALLEKVRSGFFAPLDVVVDDNLVRQDKQREGNDILPTRCWVAIRGRMLTVGPYGELYPCSDAANPGSQYRRAHKDTIGQFAAFDNPGRLRGQFTELWSESLTRRIALSRANCAYCVPSHNNFNIAVEKLYQDWQYGVLPEDQPFVAEQDHYQKSRGMRR